MRTRVLLGANLLVACVGLGWVLWHWGGPALAELTRAPSAWPLAGFLTMIGLAATGFAERWRRLLAASGERASLARLVRYRFAGQSLSMLVPSAKLGGDPLRVYLLVRGGGALAPSIASVVVDRTLEIGTSAIFAFLFAAILVGRGIPAFAGAFVTVSLAVLGIAVGMIVMARRLRRGAGVVTALVRTIGLDRLGPVGSRMETLAGAESSAADLVGQASVLSTGFAIGVAVNLLGVLEYHLLLRAFDLPAFPVAVVGAIFATGAAHSLPVPAGVGVLEGAQMLLFGALGYSPRVGLAVGLAVRLREVCWVVPGLVYLGADGVLGLLGRRAHRAPPRKPA